jgi:hypothetical protein
MGSYPPLKGGLLVGRRSLRCCEYSKNAICGRRAAKHSHCVAFQRAACRVVVFCSCGNSSKPRRQCKSLASRSDFSICFSDTHSHGIFFQGQLFGRVVPEVARVLERELAEGTEGHRQCMRDDGGRMGSRISHCRADIV